jgi:hypothetical protein
MRYDDIRAALKCRPFEPFRIVLSDGQTYVIRHPDLVFLTTRGGAVIGFPDPQNPEAAERYDLVGLEHIVRLEQIL